MKLLTLLIAAVAIILLVQFSTGYPSPQLAEYYEVDPSLHERALERLYRNYIMKAKRSPSIGLSLAEYMAAPGSQDQFHFIPSGGRK